MVPTEVIVREPGVADKSKVDPVFPDVVQNGERDVWLNSSINAGSAETALTPKDRQRTPISNVAKKTNLLFFKVTAILSPSFKPLFNSLKYLRVFVKKVFI